MSKRERSSSIMNVPNDDHSVTTGTSATAAKKLKENNRTPADNFDDLILGRLEDAIKLCLYKSSRPMGSISGQKVKKDTNKWYLDRKLLKQAYVSFVIKNEKPIENKYSRIYKITPIAYLGSTKSKMWYTWDEGFVQLKGNEDEENDGDDGMELGPDYYMDFDVTDAEGKVFPFTMWYNQGNADSNTGACGVVKYLRDQQQDAVLIEDARSDSENNITLISDKLKQEFVEPILRSEREEEFEDMLQEDSFLGNNYMSDHYLEKMVGVAMKLPIRSSSVYYNSVPYSLRVELATMRLERIFCPKLLPSDVLTIIATYDPAEFCIPDDSGDESEDKDKTKDHSYYFSEMES